MTDKIDFPYLHGFSETEQKRLQQQARFAEQKIYQDIDFSNCTKLLEVGCGVGAQSEILLRRFPDLFLTGIDLNEAQLKTAKEKLSKNPIATNRFEILKMNAKSLDFKSNTFDGAFLCWVLEHVPSPKHVLSEVRRVLKPGSQVVITEVLNSSFFLDPYSPNLWKYWMAFNDYQNDNAGDPFVGAKLGNFLLELGFKNIKTEVKTWHLDNRSPEKRTEIIEFWTELLMSAKEILVSEEYISEELANDAQNELRTISRDPNAVFYYSFIQAQALVI